MRLHFNHTRLGNIGILRYFLAALASRPAAARPSQAGPGWPAAAAPNPPRCLHAGTVGTGGGSVDGCPLTRSLVYLPELSLSTECSPCP